MGNSFVYKNDKLVFAGKKRNPAAVMPKIV